MPMASPLIAAIIGTRTARMLRAMATDSIEQAGVAVGVRLVAFMSLKSAPTQKYLPAPVSTTAFELLVGDDPLVEQLELEVHLGLSELRLLGPVQRDDQHAVVVSSVPMVESP